MSDFPSSTRMPAVAGLFYPEDPQTLRAMVRAAMEAGRETIPALSGSARAPKAIIAPHAGYPYSGATAGCAFAAVQAFRGRYQRVVLLGPAHRVGFAGIATSAAHRFATPAGEVKVDRQAVERLEALGLARSYDEAHRGEHSLEVELPFVIAALGEVALVPLLFAQTTVLEAEKALEQVWGGAETLIVISSDLSHYLAYALAREVDEETARMIEKFDAPALTAQRACGHVAIAGLLAVARRRGMECLRLDLRSSGDTAGDRERVVGYGAWAFYEDAEEKGEGRGTKGAAEEEASGALSAEEQQTLLRVARAAVEHGLSHGREMPVEAGDYPAALREMRATFVTLELHGALRGCIGTLEAHQPLVLDVARNAYAAAFGDPRFGPVVWHEMIDLKFHLSLLSLPIEMRFASQEHLLEQLRPGVDGLVLEDTIGWQHHRGTFLPAVWEKIGEPRMFLRQLKLKAGLPAEHWSPTVRLWRYTTEMVEEGS